ncbi:MAG: hypothetical protein ABSH25_12530, partial [Syntrophorhabdales bacterium]
TKVGPVRSYGEVSALSGFARRIDEQKKICYRNLGDLCGGLLTVFPSLFAVSSASAWAVEASLWGSLQVRGKTSGTN